MNRSILNWKLLRAKRTIDADDAFIVPHLAPVFLRKAGQHLLEMHDRAAAPARHQIARLDAHFRLFMKQAPEQAFKG